MRNMFSFSFLFIPLFVENYRTNQFLINFDKEPSLLVTPKILFLLISFLSVPIVSTMVTSHTQAFLFCRLEEPKVEIFSRFPFDHFNWIWGLNWYGESKAEQNQRRTASLSRVHLQNLMLDFGWNALFMFAWGGNQFDLRCYFDMLQIEPLMSL